GTHGRSAWWGTSFARAPGGYVGALAILLIPVALSSRRRWLPAAGFAAIGLIGWALTLDALVASKSIRRLALHTPIGELWLRDPGRFSYLALVAFAALAGYGAQAWIDLRRIEGRPVAVRALWLLPGIVGFALIPIAAGSPLAPYIVFAVASVVFIPLLLMVTRSPRVLAAVLAGAVGPILEAGPADGSNSAPVQPCRVPVGPAAAALTVRREVDDPAHGSHPATEQRSRGGRRPVHAVPNPGSRAAGVAGLSLAG